MSDPKFDTQLLKEAWGKVADGASSVIKDPSSIISFTKEVASIGGTVAKFLGIAENANDLRKLWQDPDEKKKHGLAGRIGLSLVYVANIAASSIAAAVVLGASVVAAPIAAAVMSGASLVKNIADYTKENNYLKKLQKEEQVLADDLAKANISFEANTTLYHDLENAKANITELERQSQDLQDEINNVKSLSENEETPEQDERVNQYLQEEAAEIQEDLADKTRKNTAIAKNYQGKHKTENTAESLARIQEKHQLFVLAKAELQKELQTASLQTKGVLEQKLKTIDDKLIKYDILKAHHEKVQVLESQLQAVKAQQANLDTKYNAAPYKDGTVDKNLEAEYLARRIAELEDKIAVKKDPAQRANKAQGYAEEAEKLSKTSDLKSVLIEKLTSQKEQIDSQLQKTKQVLAEKEKYVSLFTKDPQQAMKGDAKAVYEKSLALLDKRNEIKSTKLDRYKKIKGIGFAVASLGVAACVCIPALWPVAGILSVVGACVGVAWGISSLWDKYQKSKAEKEMQKSKGTEVVALLEQLDTHMTNKADKELAKKAELTNALSAKLDHVHSDPKSLAASSSDVHLISKSNGMLNHHHEIRKRASAGVTAAIQPNATVTPESTAPKSRSNWQ